MRLPESRTISKTGGSRPVGRERYERLACDLHFDPGRCNDESQEASGVMTPFFCLSWKLSLDLGLVAGRDVEMERFGQVQSCGVQRQPMHGGPEVEEIAMRLALGIQTAKRLFDEIDGERATAVGCLLVDWTGPAALGTIASQAREHVKTAQHIAPTSLSPDIGKIPSFLRTSTRLNSSH